MRAVLTLAAAMFLSACATHSGAERRAWPGIPAAQAEQIRALGVTMDAAASFAIFAPLVPAPPYADVTIAGDLAYGPDPRHRLDVYAPRQSAGGAARPVLVYVHGGGFVGGDKRGAYYPQSAGAWAARNGMIGVTLNYRLAPAARWPAARDDLAAALRWVRANIAAHGGDPDRIVLWGHSAGANHVADYVAHRGRQGEEAAGVRGALLLSPAYAAAPGAEAHPYYGSDAALQTAAPQIERLGAATIPLMLAYAEFDPPQFQDFARATEARLCGAGNATNCPLVLRLEGHNHFTEGASIGSADESLSGPLREWIAGL